MHAARCVGAGHWRLPSELAGHRATDQADQPKVRFITRPNSRTTISSPKAAGATGLPWAMGNFNKQGNCSPSISQQLKLKNETRMWSRLCTRPQVYQ